MLHVYGFCDDSAAAAVAEYRRPFPMRRIPDRRVFSEVFNTLRERGTLPSAHVSSEPAREQHVEEQENIPEMVQHCPSTSSTYLGVSRTRVRLIPILPTAYAKSTPRGQCHALEVCLWLHTNRQLLPLILFTDEAT
jgi:hypothetical protein